MKMIIPKERRVIVYSVYNGKIINEAQREQLSDFALADISEVNLARLKCIDLTTDTDNKFSFVYVHQDGRIETELNVWIFKYPQDPHFND